MIDEKVVRHRGMAAATLIALVALLATPAAWAVPSFARQTGMACEACHTVFPELTHFGRMFKANGYNIDNLKPVRGITATKQEMLALSGLPPISLMVQVSQTNLSKNIPEGNYCRRGQPRHLPERNGGLPPADQPVLRRQDRAGRRLLHPADLWRRQRHGRDRQRRPALGG